MRRPKPLRFHQLPHETQQALIGALAAGRSKQELAEMYLESLTSKQLRELAALLNHPIPPEPH